MADFCKACYNMHFGPNQKNDLENLTTLEDLQNGVYACVICEGCGPIQVLPDGSCMSQNCMCHGQQGHGVKEPNAKLLQGPIIYRLKAFLKPSGLEFFQGLKTKYGHVDVVLPSPRRGLPGHPVHFREGMQVRNEMRRLTNNQFDAHDYDNAWVWAVELAIKP